MASKSLGSLTIDLLLKTGAFGTDVEKAEKRLASMKKTAYQAGFAIGAAASAAVGSVAALTASAINFADELNDMSHKTGVSAEVLSAWGYAAKQSGSDIEALSAALPKFSKNIAAAADANSRQANLFKALGINVKDASGNLRSVEELLPEVADSFKALDNETTETALAMELFGKSGAELKEFLENGSSGLTELTERAKALGVVVGQDTVNAADAFNDKLSDLKAIALGFGLDLALKLLPALNDTVDQLIKITKQGDLAANMVTVISSALNVGVGAINEYRNAVERVSIAIEALSNLLSGMWEVSKNVMTLGIADGGFVSGWKKILGSFDEPQKQLDDLIARQNAANSKAPITVNFSDAGNAPDSMFKMSERELELRKKLKEQQDRLNAFLANPTGRSASAKSAGKSDADRDAERLLAQYERLKESLKEQGDLYGKVGEEVRLRYELEHGELSKLEKPQKDELIRLAQRLDFLDREKEMQEKLDRETESFNQMNDAILQQIGYLGKSADELEIIANLSRAGVDAESARGREIIANTQALQAQREAMADQVEAMDAVRNAGADFLYDWTSGSKSFKDSFLDALDSIHRRILQMIAENMMDKLFGKQGDPGGGSAGGWLGNIFGSLFGGARANGGDVFGNRAYLVGEQGPELFVPSTAGAILPAGATSRALRGNGLTQTNNFILQGRIDRRTQDQIAQDVGRKSTVATRRNG